MKKATGQLMLLLNELCDQARPSHADQVHIRGYVAWMLEEDDDSARTDALSATGAGRTYRHVAALGYVAARHLDAQLLTTYEEACSWLSGRRFFAPGGVLGFEVDGVALLGVALGICALKSAGRDVDSLQTWLSNLLAESVKRAEPGTLDGNLSAAAGLVIDQGRNRHIENAITLPEVRAALAAKGLLSPGENIDEAVLAKLFALESLGGGVASAATSLVALKWAMRAAPTVRLSRPTTEEVSRLLEGVRRSMRRWTWETKSRTRNGSAVTWPIDNEYHIQDMLWVLLSPVFPDLEDEEGLRSLGHKHPRVDLWIPSLALVIEVKFIRASTKFADVIEEVAADASLYRREPAKTAEIIAFVWDDAARTEEHEELRQGLLSIPGVVGAVAIPRPAKMARPALP